MPYHSDSARNPASPDGPSFRERRRPLNSVGQETTWQDENGDPERTTAPETPEQPEDDPLDDPHIRELIDMLGPNHPIRRDPPALRAFADTVYGKQSAATKPNTSEDEQFWHDPQMWKKYVNHKL